jgi:hypothetical protein
MDSLQIIVKFAIANPFVIALLILLCILERRYALKAIYITISVVLRRPIDFTLLNDSKGLLEYSVDRKKVLVFKEPTIRNEKRFAKLLKKTVNEARKDWQGITFLFTELDRPANGAFWRTIADIIDYLISKDDLYTKLIFPRSMNALMEEQYDKFSGKIQRAGVSVVILKDTYSDVDKDALIDYLLEFTGMTRERAEQSLAMRNQHQ